MGPNVSERASELPAVLRFFVCKPTSDNLYGKRHRLSGSSPVFVSTVMFFRAASLSGPKYL